MRGWQLVSLAAAAVVGCKSEPPTGATPSASALGSSQARPPASAGPVVAIPAGKLTAGTSCGDHPRLPSEELAAVAFDLAPFDIDAYPYPNDPTKPALTGVSQPEAQAMCGARGRRLCTELEWERACKGPKNTRYEYGDRFDAKKCSTTLGTVANKGLVGSLEACKSEFGVFAMHGFVFEWTSNAWGRGGQTGLVTQRGGFGNQPFAHHRCSAVRASAPDAKDASTGFRCCGGAENTPKVEIAKDERPVIEPVEPLEPALLARLKSALAHGGMMSTAGGELGIDKAWRWHPVQGEELFIARVLDKAPDGKLAITPAVILLCDKFTQLTNRVKGSLDEMGAPQPKSEPVRGGAPDDLRALALLSAKRGADAGEIRFEYQYGQVAITAPPWVAPAGAPASSASAAP